MFDAKYISSYIDEDFIRRKNEFWNYFIYNHHDIENLINAHNKAFIHPFEKELKNVFKNYSKPLRFCFKKQDDMFVFEFYYGRNSYLMTLFDALIENNDNLKLNNWIFLSHK